MLSTLRYGVEKATSARTCCGPAIGGVVITASTRRVAVASGTSSVAAVTTMQTGPGCGRLTGTEYERSRLGPARKELPSAHRVTVQGCRQLRLLVSAPWHTPVPARYRSQDRAVCTVTVSTVRARGLHISWGVPSTVAVTRCDAPEPSSAAAVVPLGGRRPPGIALAVWFAARTAPSYLHPMDALLLLDLSRLASDIVAFYKWSVGGGVVVLVVIVLGQGLYDMVRQARRRRPDEARMPNE